MVATTDADDRPVGRRERNRRMTMRELEAAALDEVREHGAVGLSLRAVARRMGMSPAGLYRYVASRDELLTRLITSGYEDLARHVQAAIGLQVPDDPAWERPPPVPAVVAGPDVDVAQRLRAVAMAYRAWCVAHPNEFGLLFGDPIPGYAAPPDGPTVQAMSRFAAGLAQPLVEAWHQGRIRRVPEVPEELASRLAPLAQLAELTRDAPIEVAVLLLLTWGRMHGQISLEVFGHHTWAFPDGCEALFAADVELMLRDLGVVGSPDGSVTSRVDAWSVPMVAVTAGSR